jgi:hypothetical protein
MAGFDNNYFQEGSGGAGMEKPIGVAEQFARQVAIGYEQSLFKTAIRSFDNFISERDDDIMSAEDLNAQFPDLEVPFKEPTSLAVAKNIDSHQRMIRMAQKGMDPNRVATDFLGNVAGSMMDPLGYAVGGLVAKGMGAVASKAISRGLFQSGVGSKVAQELAEEVGKQSLKTQMFEGVAGNLIEEMTLLRPLALEEQRDMTVYDSVVGSVAAGIGFPTAIKAVKGISGTIRKLANPKVSEAAMLDAKSQMDNGKTVDVTKSTDAALKREVGLIDKKLETDPTNQDLLDQKEILDSEIEGADLDRQAAIDELNSNDRDVLIDPKLKENLKDAEPVQIDREAEVSAKEAETNEIIETLKKNENIDPITARELEGLEMRRKMVDLEDELLEAAEKFCELRP